MANIRVLRDQVSGGWVQSLAPMIGGSVQATLSGSSVQLTLPAGSEVVRVASTGDCYLRFGFGSAVATSADMLCPAGVDIMNVPIDPATHAPATHVGVIAAPAATGVCNITRMN